MPRFLVVKLASLGDLLTATPALRGIRDAHPSAHIAVLTTPSSAGAVRGLDSVDEVIEFDKFAFDRARDAVGGLPDALKLARRLRAGRWDALVLLHHLTTNFGVAKYAALAKLSGAATCVGLDNGRGAGFLNERVRDSGFGARHEADYWLDVAELVGGVRPKSPRLELAISPADESWAEGQWWQMGGGEVAMLGPGSGAFSRARRWSPDHFSRVGAVLQAQRGLKPLVLGGVMAEEETLASAIADSIGGQAGVVRAAPSPGALGALLRRCRVVIANDSGPVHIAAAVGTPVVAIFGPTNHRAWGPYPTDDPRHRVVREPLACEPCIHRGHRFGTPEGCAARTCLAILRPISVLAAVDQVLAAAPTVAPAAA